MTSVVIKTLKMKSLLFHIFFISTLLYILVEEFFFLYPLGTSSKTLLEILVGRSYITLCSTSEMTM